MSRKYHHYSSHLPLLMQAIRITSGDVLELGTGWFSTPVLHWMCVPRKRLLVSYENNPKYFEITKGFEDEYHQLNLIEDWDKAEIDREWDVAFVDHDPGKRRIEEIKRLADLAKILVVHDTNGRMDRNYQYSQIYHLFKYQYNFGKYYPSSSILSNFIDVTDGSIWL